MSHEPEVGGAYGWQQLIPSYEAKAVDVDEKKYKQKSNVPYM